MATEILTFPTDDWPLDLLLFRRFKREVAGLVEATFAANPGLADLGPCPPRGTRVVVTPPVPAAGRIAVKRLIRLTGN